jgi:tetratricopeptide (TPR) repeat protein
MAPVKTRAPLLFLGGILGLLTVVGYWRITSHGFIDLDDPTYLLQNAHVNTGLTWTGIGWAFTSGYASNWHPLTWISHMVDCQLFGLSPAGHHLTNLLFHALNAMLLLFLLNRLTGTVWRGALVAALFAWHPTHVESVAWAAERKDVLSTFFFLLTLWTYARYADGLPRSGETGASPEIPDEQLKGTSQTQSEYSISEPAIKNQKSNIKTPAARYYWLALFFFLLGLMSKPMLVTLPFVLLLLDYWPLHRLSLASRWSSGASSPNHWASSVGHLIWEKLPFFALSLAACMVTYLAQDAGGAVSSLGAIPLSARVANALVAYFCYLAKTVLPVNLAVFYPLPDHWPLVTVVASGLLLAVLSWLVLRLTRSYPYLTVGWFWFVGTLVPTIGLVQVGSQSMADRYLYIPSIGLFAAAAWGCHGLLCRRPRKESETAPARTGFPPEQRLLTSPPTFVRANANWLAAAAAVAILVGCLACTSHQLDYWHDEEALFRHAMEVTTDNYLAYDHLAKVAEKAGRSEQAFACYTALLRLKPHYPEGQYNVGTLLMGMGRLGEAAEHLQAAVTLRPEWAQAQCNLGIALFRLNKVAEAVSHLELATRLAPQDPDAQTNLGVTLLAMNRPADAVKAFSSALRLKDGAPEARFLFALALNRDQKCGEARLEARKARELALAAGQQEIASRAADLLKTCKPQDQDSN